MNHNPPSHPRPPVSPHTERELSDRPFPVLTSDELRARGVSASEAGERCRPGGPWQRVLPGVYLLHPGPATAEERLHAVLLYATRATSRFHRVQRQPQPPHRAQPQPQGVVRERLGMVPVQPVGPGPGSGENSGSGSGGSASGATSGATSGNGCGAGSGAVDDPRPRAVITGLAALALHGVRAAPSLLSLDEIDVLVPRLRRLRSTGYARIVRATCLPKPVRVGGLPVAPVARALADAVGRIEDPVTVRRLLTESVTEGHCEVARVISELTLAGLTGRPQVADAVDELLAEGRAMAEERLYRMVWEYELPDPVWNVELRLPGGPYLGRVDAYWPDQAVALTLDARCGCGPHDDPARRRDRLEQLGITVVQITPGALRDMMEQQAVVVRTALMAAADREPAAPVEVLPH